MIWEKHMMNRHIKLFLIGMCAVGAVAIFSVADAEAIDLTPKFPKLDLILPKIKIKNTEEFCNKFSEKASAIAERLAERQTKVTNFINEHESLLGERRENRDADLAELRSKADQKRSEWYARLEDKADTDGKKDAVLKFKQTVEDAVDTRRETVDAAIAAFRNGVDTAIAGRKDAMKSSRDTFKTSVDAAVAKVKTDCDNGETTVTARSNFKTSLQVAREALKTDRKNTDKVGVQVRTLAEARRATVKKALADFDAALQKALAELKQAFGETGV
jgi:Na+-translocating ferredoxin:NAD+ oxidoreductase RNF subunit RnfB